MSQMIVAQNRHGIILAADKRAVQMGEGEKEVELHLDRLFPLTHDCGLIVAGAAEAVEMGKTFKNFIGEEKMTDVQEIYGASLAFLSTEYERFMRKKCEVLPIDPIHQISFVLAGRTEKDKDMPFRLYFLWNKRKLLQLDGEEIPNVFSLPRRMGLEFQLNRLCKENASLKEIVKRVVEEIERLKDQEGVSSSFSCATISKEGYQPFNP